MRAKRLAAQWAAILLLIGTLIFWVDALCFDAEFYTKEYTKLDTANSIRITEQGLSDATEALLDYLKDRRDDLTVYAEIDGSLREVFNEREKLHMIDVRRLYRNAKTVGYTSLVIGALTFAVLFWRSDRQEQKAVVRGYLHGNMMFFLMLAVIGLFAALDFDTFWTAFHKIMFSNDLWLLDPRQDILIQMVPQQFFFDLVMRIAIAAAASIGALLIGAGIWNKKLERETQDEHKDAEQTEFAA
ncbi:MAG: TIGR01906 family membrane protein [Clostridia bacterium]|nr:TIGR01906 family membrane protein [Clostridia bacterium]